MKSVALELAKGLREGKWIQITYQSSAENKHTYFWIAIKDIDPVKQSMQVDMFNLEKGKETIEGYVYVNKILAAQVIEGTTYPRNDILLERIRSNYSAYSFLEFVGIDDRILSYYRDCYYQDKEAAVRQYTLVEGIDQEVLLDEAFQLTEEEFLKIVKDLHKYLRLRNRLQKQQVLKLAMNLLSIANPQGLFPIVYRDVQLDIRNRKLVLSAMLSFHTRVIRNDQEASLQRYLDVDPAYFMEHFEQNRMAFTQEIQSNLRWNETLDERPYLFEIQQTIGINIEAEYHVLQHQYQKQQLTLPCKAFFGMYERERHRRKVKPIMVMNQAVNIDQYRVIQNAMNQDIVYVQGPPGTGKTATIVNTVLSCLLNRDSALVVSNNNEAINHIYHKLKTMMYREVEIHLPLLRLGSEEYIRDALERAHQEQLLFEQVEMNENVSVKLKDLEDQVMQEFSFVTQMIDQYDAQMDTDEQIESLQEIVKKMQTELQVDEYSRNLAIAGIEAQIQNIRLKEQTEVPAYAPLKVNEQLIQEYLFYLSYAYYKKRKQKKYQALLDVILMQSQVERSKEFKAMLRDPKGLQLIAECFPIIISTNLSVTKLANQMPIFDLLIMDEASQCNTAIALLPMMRCKRALFVGDQNQLQPVVVLNTIKNEELVRVYDIPLAYDYKKNSMLSTLLSIDTTSKFILLRDHYRCHEKIISFSNQKYYGNELRVQSRLENIDALRLVDVRSGLNEKNTSKEEVQAIIEEIKKVQHEDVAVITPFRAQANRISQALEEHRLDYVKVGTIHTFQGDEKRTILLSSGISESSNQSSFDWMKDNQELINVATTRAKEKLILVCDVQKIKQLSQTEGNDFLELTEFIYKNGEHAVQYKENQLFQSKVKQFKYYNSAAEDEFLRTLLHFKGVYQTFKMQSKVKITDVLPLNKEDRRLFGYGNQAHFDFVLYDLLGVPLLAVEVSGKEHLSDIKVMERDLKKQEICANYGMKLVTIRNDYVRRYHFVKESILEALR